MVHPALCVQFLVVVNGVVELRPHADHEAAAHLMNIVEHSLRIGEARSLKRMVAPRVQFPVVPVLHDVVDGNLALAELSQRRHHLVLRLVALATLPEAHHPLRVDGRLARQRAITADHLVGILSCNEVVVHIGRHLAPYGEFPLVLMGGSCPQSAVAHIAVGLPLDAQLLALTCPHQLAELVGVGVPRCAPTLRHHLLATYIYLYIAGIVEDEMILSVLRSLDKAFVDHRRAVERESLRQVLDATGLCAIGKFRGSRTVELEVDGVLVAHQPLAGPVGIGARQMAFAALLVVDLERCAQLLVFVRIAPAAVAVGVPQQTVVLARQHKRHAHLRVVLEQVFVQTLHVQLFTLMLAKSVESLVVRTVEEHAPRQTVSLRLRYLFYIYAYLAVGHAELLERLALLSLLQKLLAIRIVERHTSRLLVDAGLHTLRLHAHYAILLAHGIGSPLVRRSRNHQAWLLHGQFRLTRGAHADDLVAHHLQAHYAGLALCGTDGDGVAFFLHTLGCHQHRNQQHGHGQCQFFHRSYGFDVSVI